MKRYEIDRLEEVMYNAAKGANNQLFDGLAKRFFFQFEEDLREIHKQLDELALLLRDLIDTDKIDRLVEERLKRSMYLKAPELPEDV
jgi:DNA polymerase III delta subunit